MSPSRTPLPSVVCCFLNCPTFALLLYRQHMAPCARLLERGAGEEDSKQVGVSGPIASRSSSPSSHPNNEGKEGIRSIGQSFHVSLSFPLCTAAHAFSQAHAGTRTEADAYVCVCSCCCVVVICCECERKTNFLLPANQFLLQAALLRARTKRKQITRDSLLLYVSRFNATKMILYSHSSSRFFLLFQSIQTVASH